MTEKELAKTLDDSPVDFLVCFALADLCEEKGEDGRARAWRAIVKKEILPSREEEEHHPFKEGHWRFYHNGSGPYCPCGYYDGWAIPYELFVVMTATGWEEEEPLSAILLSLVDAMVLTGNYP